MLSHWVRLLAIVSVYVIQFCTCYLAVGTYQYDTVGMISLTWVLHFGKSSFSSHLTTLIHAIFNQ